MSIFPEDRTPSVYLDAAQALQNVGDPDALREMLVMMQDLLTRDVAQIAELMKQSDFPAAQHLLHALKGCMPIFCTSELCEELSLIHI